MQCSAVHQCFMVLAVKGAPSGEC